MTVSRVFVFFTVQCLLLFFQSSDGAPDFSISSSDFTFVQLDSVNAGSSGNAGNLTFNWANSAVLNMANFLQVNRINCFGMGDAASKAIAWMFGGDCDNCDKLDVKFYFSSRKQSDRVEIMLGNQFSLGRADFQIERKTVFIVHGFLADGSESWVRDMEKAFLLLGDVNVIAVDWSAGGKTWNYYKAAVYTQIVGQQISKLLGQIANATLDNGNTDTDKWGPLHLVGHSLGAHICGFASYDLKQTQSKWLIERVTGLDPAQPCFTTNDKTLRLDKEDAPYVDIIHTNGRTFHLGFGLPTPIGHADFYPNGGMRQPGCMRDVGFFESYLPIHPSEVKEAICSHGRSYIYFTETLIAAASSNCTFWGHHWDMTYRDASNALTQSCTQSNCTEMGIRSVVHPQRGTFFVATADQSPFCLGDTVLKDSQLADQLAKNLAEELKN